ncbi:MAG: CapA family protein [Candidatus Dojkabacteria bacterium]
MEMQFEVRELRKGKKFKLRNLLPLFLIIPFLGFFFYFLLFTTSPFFLLRSLLFKYEPKVKYDTFKIYMDDTVPSELKEYIKESVDDIEFQDKKRFLFVEKNKSKYVLGAVDDQSEAFFSKDLLPVGHIYWVKDTYKNEPVAMEEEEYLLASEYFKRELNISVKKVDSLLEEIKKNENTVGFVFPSNLSTQMKVLKMDKKYPLEDGGIRILYGLKGKKDAEFASSVLGKNVGSLKYDILESDKVLKINMTGVTAIARGLAAKILSSGNYGYPARDIGKFLADADLTHTSNEVSFVQGCSALTGMRFCSKPEYIEVLKKSGIDIVELTGNHNNDFGSSNNTKSIEMYKALGWDYFGGGLNKEDASKILYKEVKGNKVAFMGYNFYDSFYNNPVPLAGDNKAGANWYSLEKLESDIKEAKEKADVVIVTLQFQECYSYPPADVIYPICYKPLSSPDQKKVFREAVDLGADLVVGTQAHQPQTYEYYNGSLIFYGLGNLYFDQHRWIGTRQGIVLSIYILEGKIIQVKLTPTIHDRDLIPRVAGEKDAQLLLNLLKNARTF